MYVRSIRDLSPLHPKNKKLEKTNISLDYVRDICINEKKTLISMSVSYVILVNFKAVISMPQQVFYNMFYKIHVQKFGLQVKLYI